ncbi:MAG: ABC transporter ATP-binding protein [Mycetocola sp.]
MSSSSPDASARRSRSPFARARTDDGPRARFSQLLPYLFEHKRILIPILALSLLGAVTSLAQPLLVSELIQRVQTDGVLGVIVWALVGLVIVSSLASGFEHYLLQRTGEGVVLSSRRRLVARMLHLPIAQFDARRTGDLVSRVGSDTTLLRAVLTQGLVEAVGGALTFVGALIAMLIIDPVLLGLTVLVVLVSIGAVALLAGRIRVASQRAQAKVGDLTAALERAISSVRTIRAAGATDREIAEVDAHATEAWRRGLDVARVSAFVVPVAGVAMQLSLLVVLGVGGFRVAAGDLAISGLVAFIMFLFMLIMPLGQAIGAITATSQALGALGRIQEIVDLPGETDGDAAIAAGITDRGVRSTDAAAIEFRDVRFRYPHEVSAARTEPSGARAESTATAAPSMSSSTTTTEAEGHTPDVSATPTVLDGVSFSAERGQRTALVGPSGAGKSTILSLIERFYDPEAGSIRLDGVDIRTIDRGELRAQIGYVEQDAPVLAGTLRDNLLLGRPDATDEECISVLERVNLGSVLHRSPEGLSTAVGEQGVLLSGGERQRLAIARALLGTAPVLLLDESTSSLDGLNEQLMRDALEAVAAQRTLIVIAHRLSTVVDSDQIVVVSEGTVLGTGTHSDLVAAVPLYRDLARHQLLV